MAMGGYVLHLNLIDAFLLILAFLDASLAGSNLALLSGTLRTFQTYACDGQPLIIRCPHTTFVSVQVAQYGRQAPVHKRCTPPPASASTVSPVSVSTAQGPGSSTVPFASSIGSSTPAADCLNNSTLQYELFKAVLEACREQRQCKVPTDPKNFGKDPCPNIEKHVEVAYKCKPIEFLTKVICESEQLQLKCRKGARIAVLSAHFGRSSQGSHECPQPEGLEEGECQASYATETVMRICHGQRKCSMLADIQTFGNPCREGMKQYLQVTYTCVPTKVLKGMYVTNNGGEDYEEEVSEGDEELVEESSYPPPPTDDTSMVDGEEISHEQVKPTKPPKKKPQPAKSSSSSSSLSPDIHVLNNSVTWSFSPNSTPETHATTGRDVQGDDSDEKKEDGSQANCTDPVPVERDITIGFITEWIGAYNYLKENTEKLALYLTVSISSGLVLFLVVVVGRLCIQKRRARARAQLNISEPLPNGFGDDMSDLDQDITDLSHGSGRMPEPNVEMVRYTSKSTMRRQDSDTNPRAPMARTHNNYYYS